MKLSLPTYARRVMSAHGCLLALMLLMGVGTPLSAQPDYNLSAMRQEKFDRGLVAVSTTSGNFLSWRYLPGDPEGYAYRLYRNGTLLGSFTKTNYTDLDNAPTNTYKIVTVDADGVPVDESKTVTPWDNVYKQVRLSRPAGDVALNGTPYTYYPTDISVADADGDGEVELVVKWMPTMESTNMPSFTGKTIFGCYKLDGTQLWRVNLGNNVRTGEHINQFLFYDFDGDGKAELLCKTAPGTTDAAGRYVTAVGDRAEIRAADNSKSYVGADGVPSMGPEYLTAFSGETGEAVTTTFYNPNREGGVGNPTTAANGFANNYYGDTFGNRGDRFLAAVACLDGIRPSAVFCRGYYAASCLWAVNYDGRHLTTYWLHKSVSKTAVQHVDANGVTSSKTYSTNTVDPSNGYFTAFGMGNHNLSVADVDGDGADEIIYGSATIDHDGWLLYSTGLGHGDALHVGDLDPDRPGLEVFAVHEASPYGYTLRDARTGVIINRRTASGDTGRGMAADVDGTHDGAEMWESAHGTVYDVRGDSISGYRPSYNFRVYWDGDLQDELLGDISGHNSPYLEKWNGNGASRMYIDKLNLYAIGNSKTCHDTKGTPCFTGDILGDWREEMIFWNGADSCSLNIFTTTIPTDYRVPCLLTDHIYRMGTQWEQTAYNQPPHVGYRMADVAVADTASATNHTVEPAESYPFGRWATAAGSVYLTRNTAVQYTPEGAAREVSLLNDIVAPDTTYTLNGRFACSVVNTAKLGYGFWLRANSVAAFQNGIYGQGNTKYDWGPYFFSVLNLENNQRIKVSFARKAAQTITVLSGNLYDADGNAVTEIGSGTVYTVRATATTTNLDLRLSGDNMAIQDVTIYGMPATVTIGASGLSTLCSAQSLDFSTLSGSLRAYVVSGTQNGGVALREVYSVPAGTGVLLRGTPGTYAIPATLPSMTQQADNLLVGVNQPTVIVQGADATSYVLASGSQGVGFYRAAGGTTLPAHKAYLLLPTSAGTKEFVGFDAVTAIETVPTVSPDADVRHNLQGQRVGRAYKGIVIVKGRKVMSR